MSPKPVCIRIPDETRRAIAETGRRTGRGFSAVANEMLTEAVRMRRIPGIVFADSPGGREAIVAGTGLGVFEVVAVYRAVAGSWERLGEAFDWLSEVQLRAALAYAEAYPEEIEERLAGEARWEPEETWRQYPFTRPR
ncbi:MAG: hypothetical protein M1389_03010 [Chloroflexi bacterium]|nr:hypothetical protein [Chloroflexota bacterium]